MPGLNNTFCGSEPSWANACVGDNGITDYWTYAKGFSQAANLLIKSVLEDQAHHLHVDEYIYPVCFNMRHSVELCLKGAISQLHEVAKIRANPLTFNHAESHDINIIWDFISTESVQLDERYSPIIQNMSPIIKDIGEVDSTGQTFRYPISTESKKHLTEVSVISFVNLYRAFKSLEKQLDLLRYLGGYLIDEYKLKIFTRNLSRCQISELSKRLPNTNEWRKDSFDQVRDSLRSMYGLSSNELSKAINLIKTHYEFAPEIGGYIPLCGVEGRDIILFLNHCVSINEIKSDTLEFTVKGLTQTFDEQVIGWERNADLKAQAWNSFESALTPEMLAGLKALFYFGRELNFSEEYVAIYNYELDIARATFNRSAGEVRESFVNLLGLSNAVYNMLLSLYFLKHPDVSEAIVQRFELEGKFSWLDEARSYRLFQKSEYCGYTM